MHIVYPELTALLELARLVLTFYVTIGLMAIGFATMCAGSRGASAAARYFFLRPLQALIGATRTGVALVLGTIWAGLVRVIIRIGRGIATELKELAADARWLVSRMGR